MRIQTDFLRFLRRMVASVVAGIGVLGFFASSVRAADPPVRLGITLQECSKCGMLHVQQVEDLRTNLPSSRLYRVRDNARSHLEATVDSITHVNGQKVQTLQEYFSAMNGLTGWVTLRVYDKRTKSSEDFLVHVGNDAGAPPREPDIEVHKNPIPPPIEEADGEEQVDPPPRPELPKLPDALPPLMELPDWLQLPQEPRLRPKAAPHKTPRQEKQQPILVPTPPGFTPA